MQRAASYSRAEADHSKTYALVGSLLLLGLSYVLLLAAPVVSRQLRTFAGGHTNLGAIESWLPAACVSGLVLGGGAALMFVLVQIAREAERRPYVCLAPVLAAFSACVLIGLRAELPLQGVAAEHVAVFALAVSVAGGALVQDGRLLAQLTGVVLTLLPPLSLIGVLWANSGKSDPAVAMWTLNAQARAFLTMLTVTSFGIAIIAIVGRRGARTYADPSLGAPEYLFDANWSADESALRRRGMPGWLLAMFSAAAVGLVFVGFKVALDARGTGPMLGGGSAASPLDALKRMVVAAPPSTPAAQPAAPAEPPQPTTEPSEPTPDVKPAVAAVPAADSKPAAAEAAPEAPKAEPTSPAKGAATAKAKQMPAEAPVAKAAPAARHPKHHGARAAKVVAVKAPPAKPAAPAHAKAEKAAKPESAAAAIAAATKPEPLKAEKPAKPEPAKAAVAAATKPEPLKAEKPAKPEPEQKHAARVAEPEPPAKPKPARGDESLDELMDNIVKGKGKNVAIGAKDDPIFGL
jgi:succinate dehydrogenase hydrophobic anchor subunit